MSLALHANAVKAPADPAADDPYGPAPCPGRTPAAEPRRQDEAELAELVQRCQAGDDEAFARLLHCCADRLFNFLLRFTGNAQDAEDLAQDTFLKAYRSLSRFDVARSFLPWLFTIARRTAINHLRARRPSDPLPEDLPAPEPTGDAAATLATRDETDRLWGLARRLKPKQFEVLWLCYGEEFSVAEAATVMRTNSLHVRVLLHRARRALIAKARSAGLENLWSTP